MKDYVYQFKHKKEIFDFQKRYIDNNDLDSNKYSFLNNHIIDVFLFVTAIISLVVTTIVMYMMCRHTKLKSLVTSIALEQIRGADAVSIQEHISVMQDIECTCKMQWYTIATLGLVILGIIIFIVINARKFKLFREHLFSNTVKVMLFMSDTQYYILVKLCRTARSIDLFKIMGKLTPEYMKLKRNIIWDVIEIDWKEISMTLNRNKVNLPNSVIIPFRDKFKRREPLLLHIMLKQGMT